MDTLPNDILKLIVVDYLPCARHLANLRSVSKNMRAIVDETRREYIKEQRYLEMMCNWYDNCPKVRMQMYCSLYYGDEPADGVDFVDDYGRTLLYHAVSMGKESMAMVLIDNGADVNWPDEDGRTPLHLAASKGHERLTGLLLDRRAHVDECTSAGWTPLHYAAFKGHYKILVLLINSGADIDEINEEDVTPVELAAEAGHRDCVKALIKHGASKHQEEAVIRAEMAGHQSVVKTFNKFGWF